MTSPLATALKPLPGEVPIAATEAPETGLEPHPIALLFPGLNAEELGLLAEDIAQNGQRHPIVLYQGKILDGVNRYRACRLRGIDPRVTQFDESTTPEQYVVSANLVRRHLTSGQRATLLCCEAIRLFSIA